VWIIRVLPNFKKEHFICIAASINAVTFEQKKSCYRVAAINPDNFQTNEKALNIGFSN